MKALQYDNDSHLVAIHGRRFQKSEMRIGRERFCSEFYNGFCNPEIVKDMIKPASVADFRELLDKNQFEGLNTTTHQLTLKESVILIRFIQNLKSRNIDVGTPYLKEFNPDAAEKILCWLVGVTSIPEIHSKVETSQLRWKTPLRDFASAHQGRPVYDTYTGMVQTWNRNMQIEELKKLFKDLYSLDLAVDPAVAREEMQKIKDEFMAMILQRDAELDLLRKEVAALKQQKEST